MWLRICSSEYVPSLYLQICDSEYVRQIMFLLFTYRLAQTSCKVRYGNQCQDWCKDWVLLMGFFLCRTKNFCISFQGCCSPLPLRTLCLVLVHHTLLVSTTGWGRLSRRCHTLSVKTVSILSISFSNPQVVFNKVVKFRFGNLSFSWWSFT